jgi:hypothetical protein
VRRSQVQYKIGSGTYDNISFGFETETSREVAPKNERASFPTRNSMSSLKLALGLLNGLGYRQWVRSTFSVAMQFLFRGDALFTAFIHRDIKSTDMLLGTARKLSV